MKSETLARCVQLSRQFEDAVRKLHEARKAHNNMGTFPKERGAVKRASMELTRALADLRQGR